MESAPFFSTIADGPEDGAAWWLNTEDGVRIRVGLWNRDAPSGTVLLFPGRTEYIEKYGRTARLLADRGLATLAIDWRGQGIADRLVEDPATGQLVIDQCAALSRRISDRFDELEEAGEVLIDFAYHLEVSSPGIDRPLTRLKDFANWAGHEARIKLSAPVADNRKVIHGDIVGVEGDAITLEDRKSGRVTCPFADIESAKLVLTDRLIAATRPLDMSGADDILAEQED